LIEKLTKKQEALFPSICDKWIKIGLSTEPANRNLAEEAINKIYKNANLTSPKILWANSPSAFCEKDKELALLGKSSWYVWMRARDQINSQV